MKGHNLNKTINKITGHIWKFAPGYAACTNETVLDVSQKIHWKCIFTQIYTLIIVSWFCLAGIMLRRTILMTYKHKTLAVDSGGKIISNADIDFYIDDVCPSLSVFSSFISRGRKTKK